MDNEQMFVAPLVGTGAFDALVGFNPDLMGYHAVVAGDTLPRIAAHWYGTERSGFWTLIAQANGLLAADGLVVGMALRIPDLGWRAR